MKAALNTLLVSLAAYRISYMIAEEDGPAYIFERLRDAFPVNAMSKISMDEWGNPVKDPSTYPPDWIAEGLRCKDCISFWAAFSLGLITTRSFIQALAGSGGAKLLLEITRRKR